MSAGCNFRCGRSSMFWGVCGYRFHGQFWGKVGIFGLTWHIDRRHFQTLCRALHGSPGPAALKRAQPFRLHLKWAVLLELGGQQPPADSKKKEFVSASTLECVADFNLCGSPLSPLKAPNICNRSTTRSRKKQSRSRPIPGSPCCAVTSPFTWPGFFFPFVSRTLPAYC